MFSYARELGMTVNRMSQEMSLDEFYKWQMFFKEENEKQDDNSSKKKATGADVFDMFAGLAVTKE